MLYLMGPSWIASPARTGVAGGVQAAGRSSTWGNVALTESPDDAARNGGRLIAAISGEQWISCYEQSRLKTKAGRAQRGEASLTPSASRWPPSASAHKARRRWNFPASLAGTAQGGVPPSTGEGLTAELPSMQKTAYHGDIGNPPNDWLPAR